MRCLTDEEIIWNIQLRETEAIAGAAPYSSPPLGAATDSRAGVVVLGAVHWLELDVLMETGADPGVTAAASAAAPATGPTSPWQRPLHNLLAAPKKHPPPFPPPLIAAPGPPPGAPPSATGRVRGEVRQIEVREADPQAQQQSPAKRAETVPFSREDTERRRESRIRARSEGSEASSHTQSQAATAENDIIALEARTRLSLYEATAAAEILRTKPTRCPPDVILERPHHPDVILEHPHRGEPAFQIAGGTRYDNNMCQLEHSSRQRRNLKIRDNLLSGKPVIYKSLGDSTWPLIQSGDTCKFWPILAVTAKGGRKYSIEETKTDINVGDVVFCQVQPCEHFYAHFVHEIHRPCPKSKLRYQIGNIQGHINGWCNREHIYGILHSVEVYSGGQSYARPFPRTLFEQASRLVVDERWSDAAASLAARRVVPPRSQARSSGERG